jgi:hypothetical protein
MQWLTFDFKADYNNSLVHVMLIRNTQDRGQRWITKDTLLTKSVVIYGFMKSPRSLLDRVLKAQIDMLKWYSKNRKLVDAVEMMIVNGQEMRIRVEDLGKAGFFERITRY